MPEHTPVIPGSGEMARANIHRRMGDVDVPRLGLVSILLSVALHVAASHGWNPA